MTTTEAELDERRAAESAARRLLDTMAELYNADPAEAVRLAQALAATYTAPPDAELPERQFAAAARPYVRNGIIVPAVSVERERLASYQYVPLGTVQSVGTTARAILAYGRGRPLILWVGDDTAERDAALDELLGQMGRRR